MPPYDDWNKIDDEEDEELQDYSLTEGQRDVILFCIDCSESMYTTYSDPEYDDVQSSKLAFALEAARRIEKRKILSSPRDAIGIMLFNTSRKAEGGGYASEIKKGTYLYQPISLLGAPKIQELSQLLEAVREDPEELRREFPPLQGRRVPIGDVFTSCNWILRDGAPKTATKRIFLITDEDAPATGPATQQLMTSARTTLIDLTQAGVTVEPFFINTEDKAFDVSKFYSSVLLPGEAGIEEEVPEDGTILPESISITRIEELVEQMRFHESPKRALFSIPFQLGEGFTIGIKGYALVAEQKKGDYKYFADLGDRMEVAKTKTIYVDEEREAEVDKAKFVFGPGAGESKDEENGDLGVRKVEPGQRPFYTADEVRSFRTLGLEPGIKLLGFKDRADLSFEDNIKHSYFIYPDEMSYSGSKRTFNALLKSLLKKEKIGLALVLMRRNSSPIFCYLLPQEENVDENGLQIDPPGFHIIPLPFADDIRAAPIQQSQRAKEDSKLVEHATKLVKALKVKQGSYPIDSYPNPVLAFHNEQLEASALREEFDGEEFVDRTDPPLKAIHKRTGETMKLWKEALEEDRSEYDVAPAVVTGSKRKAVDTSFDDSEIRARVKGCTLEKLKVDQLKEFLKAKGLPVSGKKADLLGRVADWVRAN